MHDADTGLIYMHHRYYDPQLGHFLNPDFRAPDIYDPSTFTEPYAYAAGNPMMFWDPNGLHNEAGHFYTVYAIARAAGFNKEDSLILAVYTQIPDEISELDAVEQYKGQLSRWTAPNFRPLVIENAYNKREDHTALYTNTVFHALTGGTAKWEQEETVKLLSNYDQLELFGLLLHRLGDTFTHHNSQDLHLDKVLRLGNRTDLYMFSPGYGHGLSGTHPDRIDEYPIKYENYIETLYSVLKDLAYRRGVKQNATEEILGNTIKRQLILAIPKEEGKHIQADRILEILKDFHKYTPADFQTQNLEFDPWHEAEPLEDFVSNPAIGIVYRLNVKSNIENLWQSPQLRDFVLRMKRQKLKRDRNPLISTPFNPFWSPFQQK